MRQANAAVDQRTEVLRKLAEKIEKYFAGN